MTTLYHVILWFATKIMFDYIFTILECFLPAFSRRTSFAWFATLVIGFLLRSDKLGITSVVRDLSLRPSSYLSLLNFFRSDSWELGKVRECWYHAIRAYLPLRREANTSYWPLMGSNSPRRPGGCQRSRGFARNPRHSPNPRLFLAICGAA